MLLLDKNEKPITKKDTNARIDSIIESSSLKNNNFNIEEFWETVNRIENELGINYIRMDFGVPNLKPPEICITQHTTSLQKTDAPLSYPPYKGIPELRSTIAQFIKEQLNISNADRENIFITCGATQALLIAQSACKRINNSNGKSSAVFISPTYPPMIAQSQFLDMNTITIEIDNRRGKALTDAIQAAFENNNVSSICWSSPNNPTWAILTHEELKDIAVLCEQYNVIPIEDLTYLGMIEKNHEPSSENLPSISNYTDNYFIVLSASKMLSYAGERLGILTSSKNFLNLPARQTHNAYESIKQYCGSLIFNMTAGAPHSGQYGINTLLKKINDNEFDLYEFLSEYKSRSKIVKGILKKHGFTLLYSNTKNIDGFYICASYQGMSGIELTKKLLYFGVTLLPLSIFGSKRNDGVRICVGRLNNEKIKSLDEKLALFSGVVSDATL